MQKNKIFDLLQRGWGGLSLAIVLGIFSYLLEVIAKQPMLDSLVIAMVAGIIVRTVLGNRQNFEVGLGYAPAIFIPIGIAFYAFKNLNFSKTAQVEMKWIVLLLLTAIVYCAVIILIGKWCKQRKEITYLTATGSVICGASAIAISAPTVDAKPNDVSISLISVMVATLIGVFLIMPFLATLLDLGNRDYGFLAGSVAQFTGFVKVAILNMPPLKIELPPEKIMDFALSIKAVRFLLLLITIPLFATLVRGKIYIPWALWLYLGCGIIGTIIYRQNLALYKETLTPIVTPIYGISWSIALASIGLNADLKQLFSDNGINAMIMACGGFLAAIIMVVAGVLLF
jgi:uncharacterized integral membrane protein (TIGR00698 family)